MTTIDVPLEQYLREEFGRHGLTIEGLPENMTREQALEFLENFLAALRLKGTTA